jgi:hypothetical protein
MTTLPASSMKPKGGPKINAPEKLDIFAPIVIRTGSDAADAGSPGFAAVVAFGAGAGGEVAGGVAARIGQSATDAHTATSVTVTFNHTLRK